MKNSCSNYFPLLPLFLPVTPVSLTPVTLPFPATAPMSMPIQILMDTGNVTVLNRASWTAPVTDITLMWMLPGAGTVILMLIIMDILFICYLTTISRLARMSRCISAFLIPEDMTACLPWSVCQSSAGCTLTYPSETSAWIPQMTTMLLTICSSSAYGRCVYTKPEWDLRLYPPVPRGTAEYKKIYNNRTGSERVNDRILNDYKLHSMHIHGKKRFSFFAMVAGINIHLDAQIKYKQTLVV